jgi:DNA-binding NarL/FixJ family response regulator
MENSCTPSEPQQAAAQAESASNESSSPAVRVWLVDDNDQLRTLVAEMLGQLGGIDCARHFSSPDELLSTLASKPGPDVILLDVQMGDRNGLDAVRPIKSLTRSTRVLMFTTCYNRAWRERALVEGASDYLLKSETMERVAARIRSSAEDPTPSFTPRRRPSCPPEKKPAQPLQNRQANTIADRSPHLLSRTLRMLRLFSN